MLDYKVFKEKNIMNRLKHAVGGIWRLGLVISVGGTLLASSCTSSEVKAVLNGVGLVADQFSSDGSTSFGHWLSNILHD